MRCIHGKHLGFYDIIQNHNTENNFQESENVMMLSASSASKRSVNKNKRIIILQYLTFKDQNYINLHYANQPSTSKSTQHILI